MALLWQGFSLSFVTIIWFQRLVPQFDNGERPSQKAIPYAIRLILSILALLGALGAAMLLGRFRGETPGTDATFVVGLAIGVWIAFAMRMRSTPR
jgi:hypothetical protein